MAILNINGEAEFSEKVLQADKTVLVDFWAPWCNPCKMLAPELVVLAEDFADKAYIAKVNVDENPQLAAKYNVSGIPLLVVMKSGKEVNRIVGFRPRQELASALNSAL